MSTVKTIFWCTLACMVLSLSGCGGTPTMAEEMAIPGDVTSCAESRTVQPAGSNCPDLVCSKPIEECASTGGCWFAAGGLYLYPDGSWRNPDPGPGTWSTSYRDGFEVIRLGDGTELQVNVTPGVAVPGCN